MFFNSYYYLLFFTSVFFLYWFILKKNHKAQNAFLLFTSYFFYSCWDYRFLGLLVFSTLLDFFTGFKIEKASTETNRKNWLRLSVGINVGLLGVFKYYDFFAESFSSILHKAGVHHNPYLLKIILPVGISFYTFHGLSYVLDIYKRKIKAEINFVDYSLFVSFFPLLVAGPIERAAHLLPQIKNIRQFNYLHATNGLRQILWGLFKKVVVADNCAQYVDAVFPNYAEASSIQLITAAILFAFQIYGDFSGYSDMALGSAKLLGFDLLRNFSFPYFSRDIAEFWRRWHISLSSWFRDYIYIPMGGNQNGKFSAIKNTCFIFLLSGFWHGANWTFIFWGMLNAMFFLPLLLTNKHRVHLGVIAEGKILPSFNELFHVIFTFSLTTFAWIFFRSDSLSSAIGYVQAIATSRGSIEQLSASYSVVSIIVLLIFEWYNRQIEVPFLAIRNKKIRLTAYILITVLIFFMGAFINPRSFIYFQF